jgi:hypothetical protein
LAVVYRHIRLDNGQPFYIGIGKLLSRAYQKNKRTLYWQRIVNFCGYEVEILFDDLTYEQACEKEMEFIKLYGRKDINTGILVNLTDGGEGSIGYKATNETKIKIGQLSKGRTKSPETIEKWKKTMKSKNRWVVTEKTKEKIRKTLIGVKHTQERIENQRKSRIGIKLSEEAKQKLRDFWKGKPKAPFSEEHKRKLSEARIGNTNRKKKINEIGKL